jgi:hypothetical protein
MKNLSNIGRIFYGIAVSATGFQIIYYHDFPYWLIPPKHGWIPGLAMIAYVFGIMFVLAGACIVASALVRVRKKIKCPDACPHASERIS